MLTTEHLRRGKGITLESLLPVSPTVLLAATIHNVAPGGSRGFIQHQDKEMGYVLEGGLELKSGESLFFHSEPSATLASQRRAFPE